MTVGAASGAKGTGATKGGGGGAAGTTTEVDRRILWFSEKCVETGGFSKVAVP